jgi:UDP-N-acetylmuramate: L-alanyl-gamma-D-glutamyl-meso-diaminopimelate ligase
VSAAWPNAVQQAKRAKAPVTTYGVEAELAADVTATEVRLGPEGARFTVLERGVPNRDFLLPLAGRHNVENALGVYACARGLGLSPDEIRAGFASFEGVKRRQEIRGEPGGVLVIDDFAHHPTAVRETIAAICSRWPNRPLWAVFEPRSNTSRRNLHQAEYAQSFTGAARASIKVPERHDKIPQGEELDVPHLARELSAAGIPAVAALTVPELVDEVSQQARAGDLVLVMSNGGFGGFIDTLLARLSIRAGNSS